MSTNVPGDYPDPIGRAQPEPPSSPDHPAHKASLVIGEEAHVFTYELAPPEVNDLYSRQIIESTRSQIYGWAKRYSLKYRTRTEFTDTHADLYATRIR